MHPLKYLAELIGTFFLALAVSLSILNDFPLATPVVAGLTLGLFVYTLGGISGAHFNPAVTLGLFSAKKINAKDTIFYIVAQMIGGVLAMMVTKLLLNSAAGVLVSATNTWQVGLIEAIGTFILAFGVSAVIHHKVDDDASGIVIGGSLLLGIMTTSGLSNGVLNPAVAFAIGSWSFMYVLGPILGAIAAVWTYRALCGGK